MSVIGGVPFVQTTFPDQMGIGFPGCIFSLPDSSFNNVTQGYANEGVVFAGRAVARATTQDFSNNDVAIFQPHTVKLVDATTLAPDVVGIVTRPKIGVIQNYQDTVLTQATPDGDDKAGYGDKNIIPLIEGGSGVRVIVRQDEAIGNVDYGNPVYVIINPANNFGLAVGEFANVPTANVAHSILLPNAIWFLKKSTRDNTLDAVNIIKFL